MPTESVRWTSDRNAGGAIIARQIRALARGHAAVHVKRERAWASITFSGTRYCFSVEWQDATYAAAVQELVQVLPNHEFVIPGFFVADILIKDRSDTRLLVEILTIVDPVDALQRS